MKPEFAAALLALIEVDPTVFATACEQVSPDDAETLANDIVDYLSTEGGAEEDSEAGDTVDEAEGETV